jgi:hypothetical protein
MCRAHLCAKLEGRRERVYRSFDQFASVFPDFTGCGDDAVLSAGDFYAPMPDLHYVVKVLC